MTVTSGNFYLNLEQMTGNAQYILDYFSTRGWTKNSICGMLGNMQRESTINPGVWENLDYGNTNGGLGLVQWTPATNLINWCTDSGKAYLSIVSQCERIIYELNNGLQWIATTDYPMSFTEFTASNDTPENLASAFCMNYERAGVVAESERRANARYWFTVLDGGGYVPRLTAPSTGDLRWIQVDSGGYNACIYGSDGPPSVLPNCTGYVHGRWMELADVTLDNLGLPFGNAGTYYDNCDSSLQKGSTPQLGACAVFQNGGAGHVSIVEEISSNGDIVTSNSAWGGQYFFTMTLLASNNYYDSSGGGTCVGFIYHPHIVPPPGPTKKRKSGYKWMMWSNRQRRKRSRIYG